MDSVLQAIMKEIHEQRAIILEDFVTAYLAETGLNPSEVVLVEERKDGGLDNLKTIFYFAPKQNRGGKNV